MQWYDRHPYLAKALQVASIIAGVGIVGGVIAATCDRLSESYGGERHCFYNVQPGDTLSSLCESEGADTDACINHVIRDNWQNRMPGTTIPVFETDADGNVIPSTMKAGGVIYFPDVNGDGQVNGQECKL